MTTALCASSCTTNFVDPDQYQAAIHGGDSLYTLLESGTFHAELTEINVGQVKLQRGLEALPRLAASGMPPHKVGILVWLCDRPLPVVRGAQIQPGELMCLGLGMQSYHRTFGPNEFATITLDAGNFAHKARDLTGREVAVDAGKVLRPPEHLFDRLRSNIRSAIRVSETTGAVFSSKRAAGALEQALLGPMIACLEQDQARREGIPDRQRVVMARRLLEAIETNLGGPLSISELSRDLGISDRALRRLCREQLGISSQKFLALRRLHLARQALLRSERHSASVTNIAMEVGIWELGRFAVAYKALFGESPSATLRRRRGAVSA